MSSQREAILDKGPLLPYFAKAISDREIEIEWIYGLHPVHDVLRKELSQADLLLSGRIQYAGHLEAVCEGGEERHQ